MSYIIKSPLTIKPSINSTTHKGRSYNNDNFKKAVEIFNNQCPILGGVLNRKRIQNIKPYSHHTLRVFIHKQSLCADIEFLDTPLGNKMELIQDRLVIKPLIVTPLSFDNGVTEKITQIINIQIEEI